jgi:hypothetical protein
MRVERLSRRFLAVLTVLAMLLPCLAAAHPCEQEIAEAAQRLDLLNRQILALEATRSGPYVQALRNDYNVQVSVFVQLRLQCEQSVRAEQGGGAAATAGCAKDTDCKGARICVSGACEDP